MLNLQFFRLLFLSIGLLYTQASGVLAQCATPISTFPYTEGFEANDGGWTAGGSLSDWAWGTPSKPVITGAAAGVNGWITGGLTGSAYNASENSWLQSPCFDFTTLVNPEISFSVFWETERRFDGANMEYSVNNGANWILLGSSTDNSCIATNWYNNASITFLGNNNGWSGNIQTTGGSCLEGSGSGVWLTARHDLSFLAGQPTVLFRFRFGAGTICNNYDGFAIDEIVIDEAPPNSGSFTYACNGNRSVTFTSAASVCANTYSWDFGDPASGAANTSALPNPTHVFSATGTYTITLTITYGAGPPVIIPQTIEILDVTINELIPITCNGQQTGAIVAIVSGGSGGYNYTWNTMPPQTTFDLNNIGAGSYTVVVTSAGACSTSATYVLTEPPAMMIATAITDATCNNSNGSITATVTGGTIPYFYNWSNGGTGNSITNLPAGNYFLNILDLYGCPAFKNNIIVNNIVLPVLFTLGNDVTVCNNQTVVLRPGLFSSYLWQDNSTGPTFTVINSGNYWVKVTDATGCTGSDTIKVTVGCPDLYFPGAFTPNKDGKNDLFGPIGSLVPSLKSFTLRVYDRYGQMIFYSTDPYKRWDGTLNGKPYNTGTFAWFAKFTLAGKAEDSQQGTVILIR